MVDDEPERDQRARVQHEQVAGRVGLDRLNGAEDDAITVNDLGTDQLMNPEPVRILHRISLQNLASKPLGPFAVDHAPEGHDPASRAGRFEHARALDLQGAARRGENGSWRDAFGSIGDQFDDDLTLDPMGLHDATDLEHVVSRRCRR